LPQSVKIPSASQQDKPAKFLRIEFREVQQADKEPFPGEKAPRSSAQGAVAPRPR